jgi:hypothetical protein
MSLHTWSSGGGFQAQLCHVFAERAKLRQLHVNADLVLALALTTSSRISVRPACVHGKRSCCQALRCCSSSASIPLVASAANRLVLTSDRYTEALPGRTDLVVS